MTIMTKQVNIAEAKARLSALIEAALAGEEVVIAKSGKPLVRLSPVAEMQVSPALGLLQSEYGWTGEPTPYDAFAPEPEDGEDWPLFPGEDRPAAE